MTVVVALVIGLSIAAGMWAERRLPEGGQPVARVIAVLLFWVTMPFVSFFVIARLQLTTGVGFGLLLGYVEMSAVGLGAWLLATRVLRLPRPSAGALIVCVIVVNTGFVGVPLAGALFGSSAFGPAVAFDAVVTGPMFYVVAVAVAAAFGTRHAEAGGPRWRAALRNPPLLAVIAGLLAPDALAPDALVDTAHVVIYATVPLGFFLVGLTLGSEAEEGVLRFPPALTAPVGVVLALRLVVAPALMIGLTALLVDVPDAYLLQAAMPSGVNTVVLAHRFGLDLKLTASAVTWTTMVVVAAGIVAPLLL